MTPPDPNRDGERGAASAVRPPKPVLRDVLDHDRRRLLLALIDAEGELSVSKLARRIAAAERGAEPADVPDGAIEEVEQALYQHHLPKLTALQIATFDSLLATVAPGENADALFEYWAEAADEEDSLPAPEAVPIGTES